MAGEKILVVEDEAVIAADIADRLAAMGYQACDLVATGEEAVKVAGQNKPDLILMDIYLQGEMDGIEAAGLIRSMSNVPILFLTTYADTDLLERAKKTEPYAYLLKPFVTYELRANIEMALYKARKADKE